MSNTFDKLSVLDSFIEEVNSYLPEIETNLERLAQSPGDMEALEETYRRTHTIGGSASMMDFPALAHVAHGMEDILSDVQEGLAVLDGPTLDLLGRCLGRLHRLVHSIHDHIDENAIIAEDDADYSRYRMQIDAAVAGVAPQELSAAGPSPAPVPVEQPQSSASALPSFDEMLASFRTPVVAEGEEVAWPEDPVAPSHFEPQSEYAAYDQPAEYFPPQMQPIQQPQPSALDMLVASTRNNPADAAPPAPVTTYPTLNSAPDVHVPPLSVDAQQQDAPSQPVLPNVPKEPEVSTPEPVVSSSAVSLQPPASPIPHGEAPPTVVTRPLGETGVPAPLPKVYTEMQGETQVLEMQAASLKDTLSQLRLAVNVIEAQRTEFRSFLDGSKDALDRMEDWAGQAMGLNLRNSPEQVRRYLPLSVMWVANSKLKKILELLGRITGGVELTDEQLQSALEQLRASIEACGTIFQQLQSAPSSVRGQEPGWTPWEVQTSHDAQDVRESVTFERRGDFATLRNEIEARLREELRNEYESRPLTLAARMELEQQIRDEVRREFEATRLLQEEIIGSNRSESFEELEMRLRNEIEIQVRRDFLAQITSDAAEVSAATPFAVPPAPQGVMFAPADNAPVVSSPTAGIPTQKAPESSDFGEEAVEIFRLEAEEHLQTISMNVASLEKAPENRDILQSIRRATHTLKGAASMMGFRAIADLCHISEDLLDSIMEGTFNITSPILSIILDTTEVLDRLVMNRGDSQASLEAMIQLLRDRYVDLLGEQHIAPAPVEDLDVDIDINDMAGVAGTVAEGRQEEAPLQQTSRSDLSVRVRLQKLDELVNLFGEQLVNRSVLEERIQRLVRLVADVVVSSARLMDVGQKLESRFEAATLPSGRSIQVMPGNGNQNIGGTFTGNKNGSGRVEPSHLAEFDELELDRYTEFHQLARGLSEGISDMTTLSTEMEAVIRECESIFARESRLSTTFQDRLMKARLVPLSTMIPRLYRTMRSVALKQHKEIEFVTEGEDTEVDRTVYEEIAGPLLHLMRNAVNHGIETPDMRTRKDKPAAGQIKLSAAYEGNQVVITVQDDGTGIDPELVRNSAISRGLIRPDQALSPNDVIELIFRPGFSTAEVLSEESGRGVGLDVVRDSISRLRATLEVVSTPGHGTAFTMKFPTSLAIQSAMMVRVGDQQFAIPTVVVESIGRLDNFKRSTFGGRPAVIVQNELYPLNMLAHFLKMPSADFGEKAPLLLVNTGRHRVALVVDDVRGKMDVVMKSLGPHLRHVHGVAGGTVLGNGRVVLILELAELLSTQIRSMGNIAGTVAAAPREGVLVPTVQSTPRSSVSKEAVAARSVTFTDTSKTPIVPASAHVPERGKHILVVDDSPSVRRVVSNMLKQRGWEVQMARDGVEALEMITRETPAAVLLDIEMPRMDGYELMATVRAQEQYRTLPLVVLTSRAAAKHQQRAMQLGASAYIVKPYQDEELINILNSLVYGATA